MTAAPDRSTQDGAAAVPYRLRDGKVEFLLVRTRNNGLWTFPKGHVESGEQPWQTAQRESLEEAGVSGEISETEVAQFRHKNYLRPLRAFLMKVTAESDAREREPMWVSYEEALARLRERPDGEMARILSAAKEQMEQ